jgi:hypothetical protein
LKLKGDMKFKMDEIPFRILELPWTWKYIVW